jgi:uncharacterized membrane protein YgcG
MNTEYSGSTLRSWGLLKIDDLPVSQTLGFQLDGFTAFVAAMVVFGLLIGFQVLRAMMRRRPPGGLSDRHDRSTSSDIWAPTHFTYVAGSSVTDPSHPLHPDDPSSRDPRWSNPEPSQGDTGQGQDGSDGSESGGGGGSDGGSGGDGGGGGD